ncbi:hypothetical protein GQ44DRAFT_780672 [Phaeosphaeriaceae sp. PMI808]|nr:hypothetical protein GQ44DRAFT_780672 [Phaeosphaeriaceae sp. PMI808]
MAEYTLYIKIDQTHVKHFNTSGYKLCMANGVEANDVINYNVVAFSTLSAAKVTITWKEEYYIAATHDSFSGGKKFTVATTSKPILFGETYQLPRDWTDTTPNLDPHAPQAGFLFVNKTPAASAVVYKKVNGSIAPIYVSAAGPLPPGKESLTPKLSVGVWFQAGSETGTMISDFDTDMLTVDFTGVTEHTIEYSTDGTWNVTD